MPMPTKQNSSSKLSASANQILFISIQSWVQKHAFDNQKNPNKIKIILKALKRIDFFGRLGTRKFGMKRSAGWVDAPEGGVGLQGHCTSVEAERGDLTKRGRGSQIFILFFIILKCFRIIMILLN
jgi:hypothetical protein